MKSQPHFLSAKLRSWPWAGILAGLLTWLLLWLFSMNPRFVEVVYSQGLFPLLRWSWDYTFGWLPFPWLYLLVALILVLAVRGWRKRRKDLPFGQRLRRVVLRLAAWAGLVFALFYWLWGFNYLRLPLETHLQLSPEELTVAGLEAEYCLAMEELVLTSAALGPRTAPIGRADLPEALETEIRELDRAWLAAQGLSGLAAGRPRCRSLHPRGLLMQLGAVGVYLPFVLEGHVDAAWPAALVPGTMAHELGHAYGWGDEGTCNFIAWAACRSSENPVVRYSGALAYWRECANRLGWLERELVLADIEGLPAEIRLDLEEVKRVKEAYPGWFPGFSSAVYDQYLQQQGIEEGILNYARVIVLVRAWREATGEGSSADTAPRKSAGSDLRQGS